MHAGSFFFFFFFAVQWMTTVFSLKGKRDMAVVAVSF